MQNNYTIHQCGIILLAAGNSSRLGRPKQLLTYNGNSLLKHMLSVIKEARPDAVVVVLGAYSSALIHELNQEKIIIAHNEDWTEGIASSIRTGILSLQKNYPACDGSLLMVVDQPYITSSLLRDLLKTQRETGKPIAACKYENITGTPALFHQSLFPELLNLNGDKGAGKILRQRPDEVITINFPMGRFDIDTEDDYKGLQQNKPG
ncbi:MAG: nucleotidyltransferase family protein [Bacteroidetes bacterium]|nr:nucleotidyltransferase family protein [Bacteroidota bacterium]